MLGSPEKWRLCVLHIEGEEDEEGESRASCREIDDPPPREPLIGCCRPGGRSGRGHSSTVPARCEHKRKAGSIQKHKTHRTHKRRKQFTFFYANNTINRHLHVMKGDDFHLTTSQHVNWEGNPRGLVNLVCRVTTIDFNKQRLPA